MASSSTAGSAKRKRVVLSVADKLQICEMVHKKVPKTEIMRTFNIGKSTVNDICNNEEKLKKFKSAKSEFGIAKSVKETKSMKGGMFDNMDNALYVWFRQQREKGVPVTGPILLEKASEFHNLLYPENPRPFNSSTGYQWRFCNRFGIKSLAISGEKLSADLVSADEFVNSFSDITTGYCLDQIFNCDETGLYYKMLPGRTLATVHNEPSGAKKAKERVTINACSNVTGTIKLPLLFIGKAKNPRCFKGIDKSTLPVLYRNQKNAWVDTELFDDWFKNSFVPYAKVKLMDLGLEPKAILILDNCSVYPSEEELVSEDGKFISKFLPPNVTSLIQPMDQGVLECLKRVYRKSVLRELISRKEEDMLTFLKKIDMLRVIEKIAISWDDISPATIRKSWRKLIPIGDAPIDENAACLAENVPTNDEFVEQFAELSIDMTPSDVNAWFQADGPGYEHMDEQGIIDLVTADPAGDESDEEDATDVVVLHQQCPISNAEAARMFDRCLTWLRSQPEASMANTSTLVQLRELAAEKRESSRKQSTITSFFT